MTSADLVVAGCRELVTCAGPLPRRGPALRQIGARRERLGGLVARASSSSPGPKRSSWPGSSPGRARSRSTAAGLVALPGFVDAHTHLPFAGDRAREFGLRVQGWTYQQLAERGMGILTTVKATRAASLDDLLALCLRRLDRMLLTGTTTVEAKSGYGLNLEDEIKQLEALRDLAALHPVDIVPTFMGAHEVPPEYRDRREDYDPPPHRHDHPGGRPARPGRVLRRLLASRASSRSRRRGGSSRRPRPPASRSRSTPTSSCSQGGAELAAEIGAVSAEHLIAVSDEGIARLGGEPDRGHPPARRALLPDDGPSAPRPGASSTPGRPSPWPRTSIRAAPISARCPSSSSSASSPSA
ncbi:MAG: hypothetical protein MZV70_38005 [Desulfobacterales bacterium]|nr:hypothetical protein [Desulfobacterales bacterium]